MHYLAIHDSTLKYFTRRDPIQPYSTVAQSYVDSTLHLQRTTLPYPIIENCTSPYSTPFHHVLA